jgi:hypothetical protein
MLQFIEIGDFFQVACVVFETKFLIAKNYQLLRMFIEIYINMPLSHHGKAKCFSIKK